MAEKSINKIGSLREIIAFSKKGRRNGESVGLIVGSFDVLHMGHLNLFRFAKKYVKNVIIALDNDKTIQLVKGVNRPINNSRLRSEFLSDLITIDRIFTIPSVTFHGSEEAKETYKNLLKQIKPTHVFTHKECDSHWKDKQKSAKNQGINFRLDRSKIVTHSGEIIKKLKE